MCPVCGSKRVRECWHKTEYSYVFEVDEANQTINKITDIADIIPANGITVYCCNCNIVLHEGCVMDYLQKRGWK